MLNYFMFNMFNKHIISTDEDPGLRIESFAVINLHGMFYRHANIQII